ncbi:MAG TPA: hypothetical protein VIB79_01520, partial [Candidatus Binatia bacterium]
RSYPDIFPNFYLIPTPNLDRGFLLELREFALMGLEHFRWLLVALDQASGGLIEIFSDWRDTRLHRWPDLDGFEIRCYYRTQKFRRDFLDFARNHPAGNHPAVKAFVEYEQAMQTGPRPESIDAPAGFRVEPGATLWWTDIAARTKRVIELSFDIQELIDALKSRTERWWWASGHYFYLIGETTKGCEPVESVSDWAACALQICDGSRSIEEVVRQLSTDFPDVKEDVREYTFVRLLEGLHADELIEIYRLASDMKNEFVAR